jgi:hypothetical protein
MFTQRFIKLPIKIYDKDHFDLTGDEVTQDTYQMCHPFSIIYYRPSTENDGKATHIGFRDGSTILVYLSIKEVERLFNEHTSHSAI